MKAYVSDGAPKSSAFSVTEMRSGKATSRDDSNWVYLREKTGSSVWISFAGTPEELRQMGKALVEIAGEPQPESEFKVVLE